MNDVITPDQLLGFEKKKVKDLEHYYEEDKDQLEEKREVKTDEQQTTSITRGQISHFRTEFYDGILKVGEFTFDDIVKTLHVYHWTT